MRGRGTRTAPHSEYGEQVQLLEESDEENVNIFETDWYRDIKSRMTPGDNLRIYRENHGLTQARLGEMLGGVPRQHISNMEREVRSISLNTARNWQSFSRYPPTTVRLSVLKNRVSI